MVAEASYLCTPSIDVAEARWAASELTMLIRQVGEESVAGMILRQAQRELTSLVPDQRPGDVVGPFRLRIAA